MNRHVAAVQRLCRIAQLMAPARTLCLTAPVRVIAGECQDRGEQRPNCPRNASQTDVRHACHTEDHGQGSCYALRPSLASRRTISSSSLYSHFLFVFYNS